jgi:hypothetical protein
MILMELSGLSSNILGSLPSFLIPVTNQNVRFGIKKLYKLKRKTIPIMTGGIPLGVVCLLIRT